MTSSYAWHDSFICATSVGFHSNCTGEAVLIFASSYPYVTWLVHMRGTTHSYVQQVLAFTSSCTGEAVLTFDSSSPYVGKYLGVVSFFFALGNIHFYCLFGIQLATILTVGKYSGVVSFFLCQLQRCFFEMYFANIFMWHELFMFDVWCDSLIWGGYD